MNRIIYLFIFLITASLSYAQKPLPQTSPKGKVIDVQQLRKLKTPPNPTLSNKDYTSVGIPILGNPFLTNNNANWKVGAIGNNGLPSLIHGNDGTTSNSRSTSGKAFNYLNTIKSPIQIKEPINEFEIIQEKIDPQGQHIRLQQTFNGIKVYGGEIWLHETDKQGINLFTGKNFPTPELASIQPSIGKNAAIELAMEAVANHTTISEEDQVQHSFYEEQADEGELVIYHKENDLSKERLAWELTIHPNNVSHWKYFVDAQSGEILHHYSTICQLDHGVGREHADHCEEELEFKSGGFDSQKYAFGGPETVQATDLNGATKLISTYEQGGTYYMLDVSKSMFDSRRSQLPDDPVGAIWTLNAQNTSPAARSGFTPAHITTSGNNWNSDLGALGVSAHSNASRTFDYFLATFNRNSVNGRGGNIISFINVPDEDGRSMENAFWDGKYIYYGNGGSDFRELARSLDVAGHEISHGVITNTANLEYFGESGAMNEAFADIFAVMITRDNWAIGEEVVNTNTFRGGALRNLADPHNGGTRLGQPGWQPSSVSEQFRGREDNGGVHINSGIINHAFYLYSVDDGMGTDIEANVKRTEQIYYRALTNYLTTRSDFSDLRVAVILSARDLHGPNSVEVNAADRAFADVGITSPSLSSILNISDTPQEVEPVEIEENLGRDFVVYTDNDASQLYLADGDGNIIADPLISVPVKSRPSVTDDGTFIVFVGQDNKIYQILIDWTDNSFKEDILDKSAIWRNAVISRDGKRLAAVTDETFFEGESWEIDNLIYVFDFGINDWMAFELYNPTFTEGVTTGTVEFADALEFDFSGESVMYDAFNSIQSSFGSEELNYWDIGFLKVWENDINFWEQDTENNIRKLYSGLPQDDSIGNPTFSKNSPDVIAFDYILNFNNSDRSDDVYYLLGANILTAALDTIFANGILNFPSFSRTDQQIIFNAETSSDNRVIASIDLADNKISPASDASIFINQDPGAQVGVWFSDGTRTLSTSTNELTKIVADLVVSPNPFTLQTTIAFSLEESQEMTIEVNNLLGQQVYKQRLLAKNGVNNETINLSTVNSGTYILNLKTAKGIISRKIIKF